jgi:hypothetical protein
MFQKPTITSPNGFYQLLCFKKAELKVVFWYILLTIGAYIRQWPLNLIVLEFKIGGY